jgi:undecaprenyl-diphosphatase
MGFLDSHVAQFFSSFASHHWTIDRLLYSVANSYFLKGQILMLVFWWLWFRPTRNESRQGHEVLIATLIACVIALTLGRFLVWSLPFRLRPIDNPVFHFNLPFPVDRSNARGWTSFPSDHAILFVALAVGFFYTSRFVGSLAILYVAAVVCFPRIYLGFHYLTDVGAGALIGAGITSVLNGEKIRKRITGFALAWHDTRPQLFYAGMFLLTYQVASLFDPIRHLLSSIHNLFGIYL